MDAIRALMQVTGRKLTLRLPEHFNAKWVEVIVLDADDATRMPADAAPARRRPSPLMAGARIVGGIMSPVVEHDRWVVLK